MIMCFLYNLPNFPLEIWFHKTNDPPVPLRKNTVSPSLFPARGTNENLGTQFDKYGNPSVRQEKSVRFHSGHVAAARHSCRRSASDHGMRNNCRYLLVSEDPPYSPAATDSSFHIVCLTKAGVMCFFGRNLLTSQQENFIILDTVEGLPAKES